MKKVALLSLFLFLCTFVFSQGYEEIKPSKLPAKATSYVTQNFPGGSIVKAAKANKGGVLYYGTVVESRGRKFSLVFDKDGNFLQKVSDLSKIGTTGTQANPPKTGSVNTLMPKDFKPLELRAMPKPVQDYVKTKYPSGVMRKSGTYSNTSGSTFYLVVMYNANQDHYLHFAQDGFYIAGSYKAAAAYPPKEVTPPAPAPGVGTQPGAETPVKK